MTGRGARRARTKSHRARPEVEGGHGNAKPKRRADERRGNERELPARPVPPAARRKSYLVVAVSLAAFIVPAALLAGADLSGWIYPARPPAPLLINPGDAVELGIEGHLDDGSFFEVNNTVNATIGSGDLVPGLEVGLLGLQVGDPFNLTVPPQDGYGPWNASRLVFIPRTEDHARSYSASSSSFQSRYGTAYVGEQVDTQPWRSTVTGVSATSVGLRYEPVMDEPVSIYIHWLSTVVAFNETVVTTSNDLFVGDSFEIVSHSTGKFSEVRVTAQDAVEFTLDLNPSLAGKTLHYDGSVLAIAPGTGSVRSRANGAVGVGPDTCERCHADAGFQAVGGSASAARLGGSIIVNLTIDDPWLQDDLAVTATATGFNGSQPTAAASAALPNLGPSGSQNRTITIPDAPTATTVTVVVNVTAHHLHSSGGKPSDLPYQLTVRVPVGGAARTAQAPEPPAPPSLDQWISMGRITGFAALALACLSAVQGYRRHLRRAPRFRRPPWLTMHFSLSLGATVLTIGHALAFMSTTYRGVWTWDIDVGVLSLFALGVMGVTGIVLAKWTSLRAPRIRKWHYWLMLVMLGTGILHTVVSGTTLRMLLGL